MCAFFISTTIYVRDLYEPAVMIANEYIVIWMCRGINFSLIEETTARVIMLR